MWFQMQPVVQYNQVLSLACQNGHVALNEDAIICFVHNIEIIKKNIWQNILWVVSGAC